MYLHVLIFYSYYLLLLNRYNKTIEHFPYTIPIIYLLNTELLLKFYSRIIYRIIYKLSQLGINIFLFNFKFKKIDSEFFTIKKNLKQEK